MKYSYNINQKAIIDNNLNSEIEFKEKDKTIKRKGNIITFSVLDYLKDFSFNKNKKTRDVEGKQYIWINYNHIIENNPLLDLTRDSVRVHFKILVALNLISLFKDTDNTLYYRLENIEILNFNTSGNFNEVVEISTSSLKNTTGASGNFNQHNNNNHSSIKEDEEEEKLFEISDIELEQFMIFLKKCGFQIKNELAYKKIVKMNLFKNHKDTLENYEEFKKQQKQHENEKYLNSLIGQTIHLENQNTNENEKFQIEAVNIDQEIANLYLLQTKTGKRTSKFLKINSTNIDKIKNLMKEKIA